MKRQLKLITMFLTLSAAGSTVAASEVHVTSHTFSVAADDRLPPTWVTYTHLKTTYTNLDLPWGVVVKQVLNLRCPGQERWQGFRLVRELQSSGAFEWQDFFALETARGNSPFCDLWEFYFEIKMPDGRTIIDQGGKHPDYYWVQTSQDQREPTELPVNVWRGDE